MHRSPQGFWVLARHGDCRALLGDRRGSADSSHVAPEKVPEGFTLGGRRGALAGALGGRAGERSGDLEWESRPFLFRDPPDHTRLRGLVASAFTPKMVAGLEPKIEQVVTELLGAAYERGEIDAVSDFAYPLPVRIICEMLGVPAADQGTFQEWSATLARGIDPGFLADPANRRARDAALAGFGAYFLDLLAERRRAPGPDLVSALAQAELAGEQLSELELLSTVILLFVAGHETTVNLVSGGILALMENPDQAEVLRSGLGGERVAVEELLRFVSPVQMTGRSLVEDVAVGEVVMEKGEFVLLLLAAANRDPAVFAAPDRLDLRRADNRHLGFGFGIHHCLGAPLARLEAQVALPALFRRSRTVAPAGPHRYRDTVILRGLETLPVELAAR